MRIYDISHTLTEEIPRWPGDPPFEFRLISKISDGDKANVTHLTMVAHTGTHIDAPRHFIDGAPSVEEIPLESMIGPAVVLDLPDVELITVEVLEKAKLDADAERILFKTRNSKRRLMEKKAFETNYVSLSTEGAAYLVDRGVKLIGIDYLSISPFDNPIPGHQILLKANVVIVEGLNLTHVGPGNYTLYCLPIKIAGADGAPARVILIE